MESKRRNSRMRQARRTTVAGGVLLIAYALYVMLPGAGGRGGAELPANIAGQQNPNTNVDQPTDRPDLKIPQASLESAPLDETTVFEQGVLTLLIDEHEYSVRLNDTEPAEYRTISLDDAVYYAQRAAGDVNGVRIQILRKQTARAAAEHQIIEVMKRQGIPQDAIYMASELVP